MIKNEIKKYLAKAIKNKIEIELTIPEQEKFGHYSTNIALKLAREKKASPMKIAEGIISSINKTAPKNFFEKIEAASPGFINFWISPQTLQKEFEKIFKQGNKWPAAVLKSSAGKGRRHNAVVVDYCGINIAKPMHVGHLRSTIIGQALYNIFKFSGYKVIGDNHLGDWGKQFGVLIAAYKEEMAFEKLEISKKNLAIDDLMKLYVDYSGRMQKNQELEKKAREETKKLQEGNKENIKIWNEFRRITFHELNKVLKMLGIKIDYHLGESFYNEMLPEVVADALEKKVAVKSDGAVVIFTDKEKTPLIIQKSDGAYLYGTTDIATVKYRVNKFKPGLILYAVDNSQSFHLDQVFKAVKMLGYVRDEKLVHVKFGLILSEDMKKLSTRKGAHISLEHLLNEAIVRAKKVIDAKQPELSESKKEKIAKAVGIGAVKYNDLSQNRQSDIAFDWDRMLNFEGNSAPYLLYTYARMRSILRKSRLSTSSRKKFITEFLKEDIELKLIRELEEFPNIIGRVTKDYFPNYLADYLYNFAKDANSFYHALPVLNAPKGVRESRLSLIEIVSETLKTGLNLLGIETLEEM